MDYAELLVPFAEAANIRARDVACVLRARLVVSLSFVDAPRLHAALGGAADVDWTRARAFVAESACGAAEWARLLALMRFEREPPTRPEVLELVAGAAAGLRVSTPGPQPHAHRDPAPLLRARRRPAQLGHPRQGPAPHQPHRRGRVRGAPAVYRRARRGRA